MKHRPMQTEKSIARVHQPTYMESRVMDLSAKELKRKEISQCLGISVHTVNTHIERVYEKLAVHDEAEAVAKAIERRLLLGVHTKKV